MLADAGLASLVLAAVHPTYAVFLWLPFVGFLAVRWAWRREPVRPGALALGALVVPAGLFLVWLLPVVRSTASVSPGADERARGFAHYAGQLSGSSDRFSLAPEVFGRSGAVAVAALLLIPLTALAARRRWAAYVVGGSLVVFAITLVPWLFTPFADVVSLSQARRLAGFLPFTFAFAGGVEVLAALLGPLVAPARARGRDRAAVAVSRATSATRSSRAGLRGRRGSPSPGRSSRSPLDSATPARVRRGPRSPRRCCSCRPTSTASPTGRRLRRGRRARSHPGS